MSGGLDCRKCGVCCVSSYDLPTFVDLTTQDIARLGRKASLHVINHALATKWETQQSGPLAGAP